MQIQILDKKENEASFILKGTNSVYINTLRRIMLSEVPTLAIDEVNFIRNDSALYDEIIAHRLGLIPLKTDLKSYDTPEKCGCKGKGCSKCQLKIVLRAKGPLTVYSSELQPQDSKIKPVYDKMPITLLLKGQKLEFEAIAKLGIGKEHIKFSPGIFYYRAYPQIEIKQSKCTSCKKCVEVCPKKIYSFEDNKLKINNLIDCDLCNACVEVCKDEAIIISPSKEDFIFYIESFGQLTSQQILAEALNVFDNKLDEFAKKLKASEEGKITKIKKRIARK